MRLSTLLTILVWFATTTLAAITFIALLVVSSATAQGSTTTTSEFVQYCLLYGQGSQTLLRAAPLTALALMLAVFTAGNVVLFALVRPILHPQVSRAAGTVTTLSQATLWTLCLVAIGLVMVTMGVLSADPGLIYRIASAQPLPDRCNNLLPVPLAQVYRDGVIVIAVAIAVVSVCLLTLSRSVRRPADRVLIAAAPAPRVIDEPI